MTWPESRPSRAYWADRTTLRLDANRAWSLGEATAFWHALEQRDIAVEFVEEPTADAASGPSWQHQNMPLAFDETLRDWTPGTFPYWHAATAVVLKPTILGGYDATSKWIDAARRSRRRARPERMLRERRRSPHGRPGRCPDRCSRRTGYLPRARRRRAKPPAGTRRRFGTPPQLFLSGAIDVGRLTRIA